MSVVNQPSDELVVTAVLNSTVSTILGTGTVPAVPSNMNITVVKASYSVDSSSAGATLIALLKQTPYNSGTVDGTLDIAALSPQQPQVDKIDTSRGLYKVSNNHNLLGVAPSGTVDVTITYVYEYGRV